MSRASRAQLPAFHPISSILAFPPHVPSYALPTLRIRAYTKSVENAGSNSNVRAAGPALRFVAAALIVRAGEILICQRRPDQPMALQWEFPGGKIEPGETPEEALARELDEELGIKATIGPRVTRIRHNYRPWRRRRPPILRRSPI